MRHLSPDRWRRYQKIGPYFFNGQMRDFDQNRVLVQRVQLLQDPEQPVGEQQALANADPPDHGLK